MGQRDPKPLPALPTPEEITAMREHFQRAVLKHCGKQTVKHLARKARTTFLDKSQPKEREDD